MMLTATLFLPLLTGLLVLLLPAGRPRLVRLAALAGALLTLALGLALWIGYDPAGPVLQFRTTIPWIPSIHAAFDIALDGISLPLVLLTGLLFALVMVYVLPRHEQAKAHAGLFLLMETGLIGVFTARDLLLFYLFFEVALVPMYFIIGLWGHAQRRYAAIKFFLYTRIGSLAMLLSFLGLYLAAEPHTFSLEALSAARPLAGAGAAASLALLGMVVGFGVKLPLVPLHNWLPDAHVEAPTEGSVVLAGLLLKLGGYGFIRIMIPTLPEAVQAYAGWFLALGLLTLLYGALAALAQDDFKRLIAYTSVNHMGFVLLGVGAWGASASSGVQQLAINGAALQLVSHGLLTGAMFFMVGIVQSWSGTREMSRLGGLLGRAPGYSGLLALLAFGSLGLPGLSGFIAEFQVIGALVAVGLWSAALAVLGLILVTAVYVKVVVALLMGPASQPLPPAPLLNLRRAAAILPLAAASVGIGVFPQPVLRVMAAAVGFLTF